MQPQKLNENMEEIATFETAAISAVIYANLDRRALKNTRKHLCLMKHVGAMVTGKLFADAKCLLSDLEQVFALCDEKSYEYQL